MDLPMQNPLNEYALAYPILECIHLATIALGVGTAMLLDFHLLGLALPKKSTPELWRESMLWTICGLMLAIFSGLLLFSIDPEAYFANRSFRLKMAGLVLAVVFYYTAVRKTALSSSHRAASRVVAGISLGLWASIPLGGIFIGFA
jgi:hypothetical protein